MTQAELIETADSMEESIDARQQELEDEIEGMRDERDLLLKACDHTKADGSSAYGPDPYFGKTVTCDVCGNWLLDANGTQVRVTE